MEYRIPKIEEFVEGFKFEVYLESGGSSFFIMDFNNENHKQSVKEQVAVNKMPTIKEWRQYTVPSLKQLPLVWVFSFSIEHFLNINKIRTIKL
jgi:hypothetical protein